MSSSERKTAILLILIVFGSPAVARLGAARNEYLNGDCCTFRALGPDRLTRKQYRTQD